MSTIIFYNFVLLSSTLLVWLSNKGRTNFDRRVLLTLAFLLVFVPSAIRYDVGTDYLNYLKIFNDSDSLQNYKLKEPSFYYINWLIKNGDFHFQWMFAIFAFIFTAVAFKTYADKSAWLLHFLFFSSLWFFSFNGMRQAVALSWCLLAIFYFFQKKYILFTILIIIGATFHQSALLMLPLGFISLIPLGNSFKSYIAPIIFIGGIIFTYFSMAIVLIYIEQILTILGLTKYSSYFSNTKHFIPRNFGTGLGILTKILFSIYIVLNTKSFIKLNENYWLLIILTFTYAIGAVLANKIVIFGRMTDTFGLAPIIGAYLLSKIPTNRQIHQTVIALFLVSLFLLFFKSSFGTPNSYSNPKLMPYQTIFME